MPINASTIGLSDKLLRVQPKLHVNSEVMSHRSEESKQITLPLTPQIPPSA